MTKDELLKLVTVLQAELEATNKQVEILSDVLAESRREVAAIKQARSAPVQEPVVFFDWYDNAHWGNEDFKEGCHRAWNAAIKYTTPPAAPMQEPVGRVCFEGDEVVWTDEPPESGTLLYTTLPAQPAPVAQREVIKELADQYARECVEFAKAIAEGAHSMSPIAVKSGDTRLALHTAIDAITTLPAAPVQDNDHEFKNFHRQLCERFGYTHDEVDWKRDQISLIEWIAKQVKPAAPVQEPSLGGILFAVEEAIRNGDCPFAIEIAFDAYEVERRALAGITAAPEKGQP